MLDSYRRMVEALEASCYLGVTRYGMSGKLGPVWGTDDWAAAATSERAIEGAPWPDVSTLAWADH